VTRHDDRSVQDLEMRGSETDPYLLPGEAHWHRVVGLTDTDPGFVIHPALKLNCHIERLNAQRLEVGLFGSEVFPNGDPAAVDRGTPRNHTSIIRDIGLSDRSVEVAE
jgi:hypothetical protein